MEILEILGKMLGARMFTHDLFNNASYLGLKLDEQSQIFRESLIWGLMSMNGSQRTACLAKGKQINRTVLLSFFER